MPYTKYEIETIGLSTRACNALIGADIKTVEELIAKGADELLRIRNLGKSTLKEILFKIQELKNKQKSYISFNVKVDLNSLKFFFENVLNISISVDGMGK